LKVLIDGMNIIFIEYNIARKKLHDEGKELNEENIGIFFHVIINKFNSIFSTYKNPIFCWEGKNSTKYRKQIFPGYKENRKKQRSEEEYKVLKNTFQTIKEILKMYPCKQIEIEEVEGDDVIFALCEKFKEEDRVIVLSSDGDFAQLGNHFSNVMVYDPIRRREIHTNKNIAIQKAVVGDSSDGIPGLYRIGQKTFEKMIEDQSEWNKIMSKDNNQKLFETFLSIIDLSKFPKEKHEEIRNLEESIPYSDFDPDAIESFFWEKKLKDLLNRWGNVKNSIYSTNFIDKNFLKEYNEEEEIDKFLGEII
jgi:5'-3' exonuclease